MKKQIKKINIRKFSRRIYSHIKELPIAVYNKRTGKVMFLVIPIEDGGNYEFRSEEV